MAKKRIIKVTEKHAPRVTREVQYDVTIQLRIPSELKKQFFDEAERQGLSLTDWIRKSLDKRV